MDRQSMLLLAGVSALAQSNQGSFLNSVKDTSGVVVSGAAISLRSLNTGRAVASTTNATGDYQVLNSDQFSTASR